ncbi:hypothetical protein DFH29DRAFT_982655 [Suillus ampliporus]|nr:hypothetical protein DFH29DRAFT_982655 [Suillus ampliporus]
MPKQPPLDVHTGSFNLNVSGVAGFFGGEEAISAMQTIHIYKWRKLLGWYNSPGSWNVGREFGRLANSRFWDGLFPGPHENPANFFGLDGKQGPKYVASRSGSFLEQTGYLAYLIMQRCKEELGEHVDGRVSKRNKVTIIQTQSVSFVPGSTAEKEPPVHDIPPRSGGHAIVAILPVAVSIIACALCALEYDWFCCSMILLGIVSNGLFTLVIGSACLKLEGVKSAEKAPPGDGMLMDGDDIVILLGREQNVAALTRGKFVLKYEPWRNDAPVRDEYAAIGLCSFLLVIQLLGQLLLIPQGTLFGQIMFLSSFAASWAYNLYLSSIDKEFIQQNLLLEILQLQEQHMQTYSLGTRTTAAVFACLVLQPRDDADNNFKPEDIIRHFIPNDTQVWITWRQRVLGVMSERRMKVPCLENRGMLRAPGGYIFRVSPDDTEVRDRWQEKILAVFWNVKIPQWHTGSHMMSL